MKKVTIGTRGSKLALWQAEHIKSRLEADGKLEVDIKIIKTTGDKILDTPLAKIGGKGLFTKEIEEAMLKSEVDIAVHSLKDVPVEFTHEFELSAITKRDDFRDCFLSQKYDSLSTLPDGAIVGTTSLRRAMQIKKYRPDIECKNLRGNVQTRMQKLKDGLYDAIILASVGLKRLEIKDEVDFIKPIDTSLMIPSMGQGALGIEAIKGSFGAEVAKELNDEKSFMLCSIERDFVKELDGGCQVPIGILAQKFGDKIKVDAIIGMPDSSEVLQKTKIIDTKEHDGFGVKFAKEIKSIGGDELLKRANELALTIL